MKKQEGRRYWLGVSAVVASALALYVVGVAVVLPLVLLGLVFWHAPVPRPLQSVVGRLLTAGLINVVVLQLAALVQFFVWPTSNFVFVAVVYAALIVAGTWRYGSQPDTQPAWLTRYDAAGLVIAAVFVAPFAPIVAGQDTVQSIVSIAGLQSPDAGHHFNFIGSMMHDQHLDNSGYPKSFHVAVGFWQSAIIGTQDSLSWRANVLVFFAQYMVMGVALALSLGYLLMAWLERLGGKLPPKWLNVASTLALSVPLQLVILWPFVEHGFLNYGYLAALGALALVYADEFFVAKPKANREGWVVLLLLLLLGASLTWPLVVPVVLLGLAIALWPVWPRRIFALAGQHKVATVLVVLQFVPLAMQLAVPGTTSINDQGDLRTLTVFLLLAGIGAGVVAARTLPDGSRRAVLSGLVPIAVLTGGILCMQLVLFGEPRYFTIKVALLLETFLLPLSVALLFAWVARRKLGGLSVALFALVPLGATLLLVAASGKPLESVRNLFRDQTGQAKPAFYDNDAYQYARLGKEAKIDYFNSTVLHYNAENNALYSHPFLPQIAQYMKYDRSADGMQAYLCHRLIFRNIAYGDFSAPKQKELVAQVQACANIARENGQKYYIITDEASLQKVKAEIGEGRGIVYVGT